LCFEQSILHRLILIKHFRTPGPFNSLLQVVIAWYQVVAGVSFSPLWMPSISLNYLDSPWLDSTCKFLAHCQAQLLIPDIPLSKLQRQHDACIMNGILDLNLSATTMKRINSCRLWFQVTTLSDICTLKGNRIDRNTWLGFAPMPSTAADWPIQGRPHDSVWSI
jgi:hypothetical protein